MRLAESQTVSMAKQGREADAQPKRPSHHQCLALTEENPNEKKTDANSPSWVGDHCNWLLLYCLIILSKCKRLKNQAGLNLLAQQHHIIY